MSQPLINQPNTKNYYEDNGRLYIRNTGQEPVIYGKNVKNQGWIEKFLALFTSMTMTMTVKGQKVQYSMNINKVTTLLGISRTDLKRLATKSHSISHFMALSQINNDKSLPSLNKDQLIETLILGQTSKVFKTQISPFWPKTKLRYFIHLKANGKLNLYKRGEKLGSGSFSHVFKGTNVVTHKEVAIKKARTKSVRRVRWKGERHDSSLRGLKHEHSLLNTIHDQLTHQHLSTKAMQDKPSSEIVDRCYITPLCGTNFSLFHAARRDKKLILIYELFKGLENLHSLGYSHLDIKPGNLLIKTNKAGEIKALQFADFGGVIHDSDTTSSSTITLAYTPKDVIPSKSPRDIRAGFHDLRNYPTIRPRMDVYATSKSVIESLLNERIHNKWTILPKEEFEAETKDLIEDLTDLNIPEDVATALVSGLNPERSRPTSAAISGILHNELLILRLV